MKNAFFYQTPIGKICIIENGEEIIKLSFENEEIPSDAIINETKLLKQASNQLYDYFDGKIKEFNLPLAPRGTAFQQKVWNALQEIPYGETRCYGDIAEKVGNSKASRAVGNANNKNPIAIFIPCHRVIGKNGKLVGFAGGLDIKMRLLSLEKA